MSTTILPDRKLLKIADLARQLAVSTRTIWRYVALGRLPAPIRFTKVCVRWQADEVQRYLEQLKAEVRGQGAVVSDPGSGI